MELHKLCLQIEKENPFKKRKTPTGYRKHFPLINGDYEVHHINLNHGDNTKTNLIMLDKVKHNKIHTTLARKYGSIVLAELYTRGVIKWDKDLEQYY